MVTPLVRDSISQLVSQAIEEARREGLVQLETSPEVLLERPGNPGHGDFATSLPLRLARATRINPLELAQMLVERIPASAEVARVEAAHPGFINFFLDHDWVRQQVEVIRHAGSEYGRLNLGNGRKVMVEFVSVNPTGPVHVGHTRGAVMGSTLAAILDAAGFNVTREYYVNDAGNQMDLFYRSVYARYLQSMGRDAEFPANGYQGDYKGSAEPDGREAEASVSCHKAQALSGQTERGAQGRRHNPEEGDCPAYTEHRCEDPPGLVRKEGRPWGRQVPESELNKYCRSEKVP